MHLREEIAALGSSEDSQAAESEESRHTGEAEGAEDAARGEATGAHAATEASAPAFRGFLAVVLAFAFSLAFMISRDGASA